MNYYERHLGDYAKDAGHLTMIEQGAYTLLLDRYYTTEQGIRADQAHRVCRARSKDEQKAVDSVLAEFFTLTDGVWINARAEREIAKMQAKVKAAQENGKRGGRPKGTKKEPGGFPLGSDSVTQEKALQSPVTRHQDKPPLPPEGSAGAEESRTRAGAIGVALKAAGIDPRSINLSDPVLRSLADQGATPEEFGGLAREAVQGGKRNPMAWVLAVLPQRRSDAAAVKLTAPTVTTAGESVEAYQARMTSEREAERQRLAGSRGPSPEVKAKLAELAGGMRIG